MSPLFDADVGMWFASGGVAHFFGNKPGSSPAACGADATDISDASDEPVCPDCARASMLAFTDGERPEANAAPTIAHIAERLGYVTAERDRLRLMLEDEQEAHDRTRVQLEDALDEPAATGPVRAALKAVERAIGAADLPTAKHLVEAALRAVGN